MRLSFPRVFSLALRTYMIMVKARITLFLSKSECELSLHKHYSCSTIHLNRRSLFMSQDYSTRRQIFFALILESPKTTTHHSNQNSTEEEDFLLSKTNIILVTLIVVMILAILGTVAFVYYRYEVPL